MNASTASTMRRTRLDAFETTGSDAAPAENVPVNWQAAAATRARLAKVSFARRRVRAARNQADSRDIENRFRDSVQTQVTLDL